MNNVHYGDDAVDYYQTTEINLLHELGVEFTTLLTAKRRTHTLLKSDKKFKVIKSAIVNSKR
jgi:hypothetical protein